MTNTPPPPGWYPDVQGISRWWDGGRWTEHTQPGPAPQHHSLGPMTSGQLNVKREVVYNRQQTGHSLTLWIILSMFLLFPVVGLIYYSVSPNHYWHV